MLPDTLRVATIADSVGYFFYRDEPMGLHYDMVKSFAGSHGMEVKIIVAADVEQMKKMLGKGEVDLLAYSLPTDSSKMIRFCALNIERGKGWGVRADNYILACAIDKWCAGVEELERHKELRKKYYEISMLPLPQNELEFPANGSVSPFDGYFRAAAMRVHLDWRLLAAVGYAESRFKTDLVSWAGAKGVMQIMPSTAKSYSVSEADLEDPSVSIDLGASILRNLYDRFETEVPSPVERRKFMLAAYNVGIGHVFDAIEIARVHNMNPCVWSGSVEVALAMKRQPEIYGSKYVKYGFCNATETIAFVEEVEAMYLRFRRQFVI